MAWVEGIDSAASNGLIPNIKITLDNQKRIDCIIFLPVATPHLFSSPFDLHSDPIHRALIESALCFVDLYQSIFFLCNSQHIRLACMPLRFKLYGRDTNNPRGRRCGHTGIGNEVNGISLIVCNITRSRATRGAGDAGAAGQTNDSE
jgi:hypothetical protein